MRRPIAFLAACAALGLPLRAHANGRYPLANQLAFGQGDDLVVRTTFGLLVTHDRAKFDYVCEAAVGYGGVQDPGVAMFADGSIAVAAFEGLAVTHDGGCTWVFAGEDGLGKQFVIDDTVERGDPSRGYAITSTGSKSGFYNQIFRTEDDGRTWTKVGDPLPSDIVVETMDVAPSDPSRLYVSGTANQNGAMVGVFEVSKDGGASWTRRTIDLVGDEDVYIGAVDPTDADRVYVRTHGAVNDRLLVSKDGGATFAMASQIGEPMLGLAVSPDGKRVAIGGKMSGLLVAGRDDLAFASAPKQITVTCLAWDAGGLYACADGFVDGFEVGRSTDEGATWTPVLKALADIAGPIASCGTAYHDACDGPWDTLKTAFDPNGSGGSSSGQTPVQPDAAGNGKSGCAFSGPASGAFAGAWLVVAAVLAARRNRR